MRNKASFIRKAPAFSGASPASVKQLAEIAEIKRVSRRAPLWAVGDRRRGVLLIRSGIVRESFALGTHPVTLGFFGRNEVVGGEVALGYPPGGAAEAYEDCVALQFPARALRAILDEDPGLGLGLAKVEIEKRLELQQRLAMIAHRTAAQRLASCFLQLALRFGVRDSRGTIVNLRLTHREMAGLIGATRETVSFSITDLRQKKLIETEGKRVVLLDPSGLTRMASEE